MDLKQLVIQLEADGFRLIDKGAGLGFGTQLNLRYEVEGGEWTTKITPFEREAPSLWQPFRKSMFVYTGARPVRVLVGLMDGGFTDDLDTGNVQSRRAYYQRNNFRSYPDFDDDSWDSYDSRTYFSSTPSHRTDVGGVSGEASAEIPPPPPLPVDVPLERDEPEAVSGEATVSEEVLRAAAEPLEAGTPSEPAGIVSSSEPNAY